MLAADMGLGRQPDCFSLLFLPLSAIHPLGPRSLGPPRMPTKSLTRSQPQKSSTTSVPGYRVKPGSCASPGRNLAPHGRQLRHLLQARDLLHAGSVPAGSRASFCRVPARPALQPHRAGVARLRGRARRRHAIWFPLRHAAQSQSAACIALIPSHVLLDPYARALSNGGAWGQYPAGKAALSQRCGGGERFRLGRRSAAQPPSGGQHHLRSARPQLYACIRLPESRIPGPMPG